MDLYRFYFWKKGQVKFFCFVLIPHFRVPNMAAIYIYIKGSKHGLCMCIYCGCGLLWNAFTTYFSLEGSYPLTSWYP